MYVPDRTFMKRLRSLDRNLDCYYERSHGHFVITYRRAIGQPVPLFIVQGDDGGFRQPDQRDINKLHESDLHREDLKNRLQKTAKYMEAVRRKKRKQARELFRDRTKDDKLQLMQAFGRAANTSKSNSAFRRIKLKPRGKVFSQATV